jgi:hypothetical protein
MVAVMIESISFNNQGVTVILSGVITSQEVYDANTEIISHPNFLSLRYQLCIFKDISDFQLSTQQIMLTAQRDIEAAKLNCNVKVAIVTDSTLIYGLGRMYDAFSDESSWQTELFWTIEEARHWLEIT